MFLLILALTGCGLSEDEFKRLATEEFERKAKLFRQDQKNLCLKTALEEAERQADSIISNIQFNPLRDTLYRPIVPPKPDYVPTDSAVLKSQQSVKPIIDSTTIK